MSDCATYEVIVFKPSGHGATQWAVGALVHTDEGTTFVESPTICECFTDRQMMVLHSGLDELREAEVHPDRLACGPHFHAEDRRALPRGVDDSVGYIRENLLPGEQ